MSLIVQKFGGTSVADNHHLLNVAKKVTDLHSKGHDVIVVVSAQGDTTDKLIKAAQSINPDASKREMDVLLSTGEQISISLLCMAIEKLGFKAISLTGWQAGFLTDSCHYNAQISKINTKRIKKELDKKNIVVIAGFQGIDENEDITTLGRGGSDTSAVAVAAAVKADMCKIYTDVDGVYTADPRIVPSAKKISTISYDEMFALSDYGAQVLNKRSIEAAKKYSVEIEVLSSTSNNSNGTVVKDIPNLPSNHISGISLKNNLVKVLISDINEKTFSENIAPLLKNIKIENSLKPVGKTSSGSTTFVIKEEDLPQTIEILKSHLKDENQIFYEKNKSEISIINLFGSYNINTASIVFQALSESEIETEMVACTNNRVSIIVPSSYAHKSLNIIHSKLFEEDNLI
ncbi:MAG: aspartate kinase [Clostridia bacterium]|nr:aspartate kinase [Clostridia bacterium]